MKEVKEERKIELKFRKLTPDRNIDLGIYEEAIEYAFSQSDIRNIAISGAYGSGKSSVIETYEEMHKEEIESVKRRKFLHISLAHFEDVEYEKDKEHKSDKNLGDKGKNDIDDKKTKFDKKIETRLEGKILNQLIHQIKPSQIPLTGFKVKRETDESRLWEYTWYIAGFIGLLYFIMFNDKCCELLKAVSDENEITRFIYGDSGKFLAAIAFCTICIKGIYIILKLQAERKILKKFTIQGNEFEILGDCEDSYLDRYLNEVLYLFGQVDADAIVFEDIDRFGSNQIFEKLREINVLLSKRGKELRFFYLLKDDIFVTTDRTKFFDFIIPVVPVIDGSNSYNMFLKYFEEAGIKKLFQEEFLEGLTLFIDDMRLLKNIINEFQIYYGRFNMEHIGLDWNKLLAIITYKNIFPKDFGELQVRRGYVYALFAQKEKIKKELVEKLKNEVKELELKINGMEDELCNNLLELDAIYFSSDKRLRVDGKEIFQYENIPEFVNAVKNNPDKVQYFHPTYYSSTWNDYNPKPLFDNYQNSEEYKNRKAIIEKKEQNFKLKYQQEIIAKENYINQIEKETLRNLIKNKNGEEFFLVTYKNPLGEVKQFEDVKRSPYFELIQYLIKEGHIDESYSDYMTYFYENSITAEDKKFMRAVLGGNRLSFNHQLRNPELVISKLKEQYFDNMEVLNFDVLDYLFSEPVKYEQKLNRYMKQLCKLNEEEFIRSYLIRGVKRGEFIRKMNENSTEIANYVLNSSMPEEIKIHYMIDTLCISSNEDVVSNNYNNTLKLFVEDNIAVNVISDDIVSKVLQGMRILGVKIRSIDLAKVNKVLFSQMYVEKMYKLNKEMVEAVLHVFYGVKLENVDWSRILTHIFRDINQPLKSYVEENLAECIKLVLKESDMINDKEEVALFILNNESIEKTDKYDFIHKYQGEIMSLEKVEDRMIWSNLLEENVLAKSENNLVHYYYNTDNQLDEHLVRYINDSKNELILDDMEIDNRYGDGAASKLFDSLTKCKEITDDKLDYSQASRHN